MKLKINVTAKDIENGQKCSASCCPIALSLKRKGLFNSSVGSVGTTTTSFIYEEIEYHRVPLPLTARQFIHAFDDGIPVKPFSFTLELK